MPTSGVPVPVGSNLSSSDRAWPEQTWGVTDWTVHGSYWLPYLFQLFIKVDTEVGRLPLLENFTIFDRYCAAGG